MNSIEFQKWITARWDFPLNDRDLSIAGMGLGGEAGECLEHIKKYVRDKKPRGTDFLLEAGDVLHYLTVHLTDAGFTLEQAMMANMHKLEDRDHQRRMRNEKVVP